MYCQACKSNIDREGTFCPRCGSVLVKEALEGKMPLQEIKKIDQKPEAECIAVELAKQEDISSSRISYPAETPYYQEQFCQQI